MTTSPQENRSLLKQEPFFYNEQLNKIILSTLPIFDKKMKSYVLYTILFFIFGLIQLFLIVYFLSFLAHSSLISLALSLFFLTTFSYFIFRAYYKTKKTDQLNDVRKSFYEAVESIITYQEDIPECHIAMANAYCKFSEHMIGREYAFYKPPKWLNFFAPFLEKFSCWSHWHDVHSMKEMLLSASVDEHIKLVKFEATSLEAHASLANAYILLSEIYSLSYNLDEEDEDEGRWIPSKQYKAIMDQKFKASAERAIEEFKILSAYSPHDPWVHEQLAYSYHDLQMPLEEIQQYELILKLNPNDTEIIYKLGVLNFQLGRNAQGLQIYEQLKRSHYKKAEALIHFYGAYQK